MANPKSLECYLDCILNSGEIEGTDFQFCRADVHGYNRILTCPLDDEGKMGGIPQECPIYQCEVDAPWDTDK